MGADVRNGLVGGVLATILTLTFALSYAVLIFNGDMAAGMNFGITAALLSAAVISIAVAAFGTLRFQIGTPMGNTAAVMAAVAASIERTLHASAPQSVIPTVLIAIALSTIIVGVTLFALGLAGAGHWMRFVPYPVVGGVLGAAGWLFLAGSLRVIAGPSRLELYVGLCFALLLVIATMRTRHALVIPALLFGGVIVFYAVLAVRGISFETARSAGWFLMVPHGSPFANPWSPGNLRLVWWPALTQHLWDLLTLVVVSVLAVLLNAAGVELATRSEADLDRELRVQGAANVVCGFFGGLIGLGGLSNTLLSHRIAGNSRIPPLVVAVASIGALLGGTVIVQGIPRFIFGALIFSTGFGLLYEWCVRTARRLPLYDYLSILAIVAVVVRFGYVAGVLCGILIGCIIFVVTYSRVRVVKHSLNATEFRSSVLRSRDERAVLQERGGVIRILILQGFIFFGMADQLYRTIKAHTGQSDDPMEFLILDFHNVSGLDSSAVSSFAKIVQLAEREGIQLVISGMSSAAARRWHAGSALKVTEFHDLDGALEFCESSVLQRYAGEHAQGATLERWLQTDLGDNDLARRLILLLERRTLAEGEVLCAEGTPADEMFFIEQGRVAVTVGDGSESVRLRSLGDRTILGEMGMYRSRARSASVTAEKPSVVYVFHRPAFLKMENDDPALAAAFHAAIVRTLADRLEFESGMVASLQR